MPDEEPLRIVHSDFMEGDQLIVDFSDGTTASFTADQLSRLADERVLTDSKDLGLTNPRSREK
jgi:hypothetical protein